MKVLPILRVLALAAFAPIFATASLAQTATPDVSISELKIGSPVYGTDGIRIGEINRIKANSDGRVLELQVTTGGPAGLTADVVSISPDKIASSGAKDVKLNMSAADVHKLPTLAEDQKG
jgi:hypothetical protein